MLAMAVKTGEADLAGKAGNAAESKAVMTFYPEIDTYNWFKVFQNVQEEYSNYPQVVLFTPDGRKLLASQVINDKSTLVLLNPETGEFLGGMQNMQEMIYDGYYINNKKAITMNDDGSLIYFLAITTY